MVLKCRVESTGGIVGRNMLLWLLSLVGTVTALGLKQLHVANKKCCSACRALLTLLYIIGSCRHKPLTTLSSAKTLLKHFRSSLVSPQTDGQSKSSCKTLGFCLGRWKPNMARNAHPYDENIAGPLLAAS